MIAPQTPGGPEGTIGEKQDIRAGPAEATKVGGDDHQGIGGHGAGPCGFDYLGQVRVESGAGMAVDDDELARFRDNDELELFRVAAAAAVSTPSRVV